MVALDGRGRSARVTCATRRRFRNKNESDTSVDRRDGAGSSAVTLCLLLRACVTGHARGQMHVLRRREITPRSRCPVVRRGVRFGFARSRSERAGRPAPASGLKRRTASPRGRTTFAGCGVSLYGTWDGTKLGVALPGPCDRRSSDILAAQVAGRPCVLWCRIDIPRNIHYCRRDYRNSRHWS